MATLPAPDQNHGPVHVLRRKQTDPFAAAEAARRERIEFNTATVEDWEIEKAQATTERQRERAALSIRDLQDRAARAQLADVRGKAEGWKILALSLAGVIIIALLAMWQRGQ